VHRSAIWAGIDDGVVDVLGSDHAPHTREEKAKTYPASPSGMTGVQTLVPSCLITFTPEGFRSCVLSISPALDRRVCSALPQRAVSPLAMYADLTVVDLKRRETITDKWVASRAGWTPYDGVAVTGWAGRNIRSWP
jgi:dihydroorotase